MLRSIRTLGALGAGLAAATALVTAAPASAQEDDFTLYAREVAGDEEEDQQQAPEVGDTFSFADDLFEEKGGDKVGRDGGACTVVRTGNPLDIQCVGTFVLTGGQITAQVLMTVPLEESAELPAFDASVTGGTGDYRGASGQIHITEDGAYEKLDFDLGD
ncbi:allene oxide cyclase barrel-like domain-containing protein [Streptomyces cupreus]|uniref:Dirigent protein n=1 Tax=Streptomyces cupreus TaxID=2759956 RepID=A0A7X1IY95_9ACTN|nr:dirigent protein [Streptomyces cupreus]MBC2900746.1 dirigent protein [Streptomyces cupreus]